MDVLFWGPFMLRLFAMGVEYAPLSPLKVFLPSPCVVLYPPAEVWILLSPSGVWLVSLSF